MRQLRIWLVLFSSLFTSIAFAKTYIFTGTGNWNDPSHWKEGLIPSEHTYGNVVVITGNVTLTGNVTYKCGLSISTGSSLTIATGATLTLQFDPMAGCLGPEGGLSFSGATLTVQAGAVFNCNDWIYECGTLNVNGIMKCNYLSQSYVNAPATINGTLEIGGGLFAAFVSPVTINNGGVLRIKSGTGFSATNTITINAGGTLDNMGTIKGNTTINTSSFINTATLSPGNSPGTITINGDYTPTLTANHIMEIGGTSAGSYDQINVSGNVNLDGVLNASLYGGFTPSTSNDIPIITANSVSGTFSSVSVPAGYTVVYNPTSVVLRFSSLMPVNFVSLIAKKESSGVAIIWKVADEKNVSGYEIEKSFDGLHFEKIGWVSATGNTLYSFKDPNLATKNYYKIRSVDLDNSYRFSAILKVSSDQQTVLLKAFPSPAKEEITLQHPTSSSKSKILVNAIGGRTVMAQYPNPATQQTRINISQLKTGVYVIVFQDDEQIQTLKIIKE